MVVLGSQCVALLKSRGQSSLDPSGAQGFLFSLHRQRNKCPELGFVQDLMPIE